MSQSLVEDHYTAPSLQRFGRRWRQRAIRKWGPAYILLLPSVLLLAGMMIYPLAQTVIFSLSTVELPKLTPAFAGIRNFVMVATDRDTGPLIARTVTWIFATVFLRFVLGFLGAIIFNARVRGTIWLRVLVILPWTLPSVVAANLWRWILQSEIGILNETLKSWGLGWLGANWLGDPRFTLASVVVAYSWAGFPFVMLLLLAGMQGIPEEQYEAARVEGATTWQCFRYITVPSLRGIITITLLLETVSAVNSFDTINVITAGGPANATTTFGIRIYQTGFQNFDFGGASAYSVWLFAAALVVFILYSLVNRRAVGSGSARRQRL